MRYLHWSFHACHPRAECGRQQATTGMFFGRSGFSAELIGVMAIYGTVTDLVDFPQFFTKRREQRRRTSNRSSEREQADRGSPELRSIEG